MDFYLVVVFLWKCRKDPVILWFLVQLVSHSSDPCCLLMTRKMDPSGKVLIMFQASKRVISCRLNPWTCRISSPHSRPLCSAAPPEEPRRICSLTQRFLTETEPLPRIHPSECTFKDPVDDQRSVSEDWAFSSLQSKTDTPCTFLQLHFQGGFLLLCCNNRFTVNLQENRTRNLSSTTAVKELPAEISSWPLWTPSSWMSSLALLQMTTTASFWLRVWRRAAVASACVTSRRLCPLIDRTSSPFWMVPSWAASLLGNTLCTWMENQGGVISSCWETHGSVRGLG